MRSTHNYRFRFVFAVGLVLVLVAAACGTDTPIATTAAPPETTAISVTTSAPPYSIVEDASYLNVRVGRVEPIQAHEDPALGEWSYATGPVPAEGPAAGFIMYRRWSTAGDREDLAVLLSPQDAVDAIRLTGDTSQVHLGLSCADKVVVLAANGVPMNSSSQHHLGTAIRAWRSGPDGTIEELDPATSEPKDSC